MSAIRVPGLHTPLLEIGAPLHLDGMELIEAESLGCSFLGVRGDFTGIYLAHGLVYEDNVLNMLLTDAKGARQVVDVGSNIGLIALPAARALLPGGEVHCLDISQRNCRLLQENARRNGIGNIVVYPTGAGEAFAAFTVAINRGSTLQALSRTGRDGCLHGVEMAMTVALDTVFADGPRIDILKIDTDGYEYRVLRGAERLLREHKPIVYLEYTDHIARDVVGVPGVRVLELLDGHGYQPTILHRAEPPQAIERGPDMIETVSRLYQRDWDAGITHLDIRWHVPE